MPRELISKLSYTRYAVFVLKSI